MKIITQSSLAKGLAVKRLESSSVRPAQPASHAAAAALIPFSYVKHYLQCYAQLNETFRVEGSFGTRLRSLGLRDKFGG